MKRTIWYNNLGHFLVLGFVLGIHHAASLSSNLQTRPLASLSSPQALTKDWIYFRPLLAVGLQLSLFIPHGSMNTLKAPPSFLPADIQSTGTGLRVKSSV